jgi:hypothetical protein
VLDERRGRPELVREFGQDTMMAFLVFEDVLREIPDGRIWR